jgi:hypothetical protein
VKPQKPIATLKDPVAEGQVLTSNRIFMCQMTLRLNWRETEG